MSTHLLFSAPTGFLPLLEANPRLREAGWEGDFTRLPLLGDGLILPLLKLEPYQHFPIRLNFTSLLKDTEKAVRHFIHLVQYEERDGQELLVGGNLVILNNSPGKPDEPDGGDCTGFWCRFNNWLWLAVLLGVLIAGVIWYIKKSK